MLIAAVALRLGWSQGWLHDDALTGKPDFASSVLGAFFSLNLLLGTFNLLPVPPLDGSTAIMLFMSETRSQRYLDWLRGNSYAMVGLLLAIVAFRYVYAPIKAVATYYLLQSHF
jgi:Zn-dependent protease